MAAAGRIGMVYDPVKAKEGVELQWATLQELKAAVAAGLDRDSAHAAVQKYRTLPTFQINWSLIGILNNFISKKKNLLGDGRWGILCR